MGLRHWRKENLKTIALIRSVPSINDILLFSRLFAARSLSVCALLSQCPAPSSQFPVPAACRLLPAVPQHFVFLFFLSYFVFIVSLTKRRALYADCALSQTFCLLFGPQTGHPDRFGSYLCPGTVPGPASSPDPGRGLGRGRARARARSRGTRHSQLLNCPLFSVHAQTHREREEEGAGVGVRVAFGCDYNWIRFDSIGFIVTSFCNYPC